MKKTQQPCSTKWKKCHMYIGKPLPLLCNGESHHIFSTLRSVLSGVAGALRTSYQAFVLISNAVVSLHEGKLGDLGYFQLICIVFHNLVNGIYTQITSLLRGQISVNVTLV